MFAMNPKTSKLELHQHTKEDKSVAIVCGHDGWTLEGQPDSKLPVCKKGERHYLTQSSGPRACSHHVVLMVKLKEFIVQHQEKIISFYQETQMNVIFHFRLDFSIFHTTIYPRVEKKHLDVARIEPRSSILGFTDQSYLDLVSSECLSGHLKQCREGCDQNLPQFVGSISSGNGNSGFYVGDEATFVCLAGFGINPAMKNSAKSTVKWLGG